MIPLNDLSMHLADYDFDLPGELIAAFPSEKRGDDRLLVLDRNRAELAHRHFSDLPAFLRAGDLLVLNDVKVRRARLRARKSPGGGAAAVLLIKPTADETLWECLLDTHRRLRPGQMFLLADGTQAELVSRENKPGGSALIRFERAIDSDFLDRYGEVPLPPYILKRRMEDPAHTAQDDERYQTVYADQGTALAAPTAGLHFTQEMLARLEQAGVRLARLTLDVGWGTFAPIRTEDIRRHQMHAETFELSPQLVREVISAKQEARRVVAVGTTVVRALESAAAQAGTAPTINALRAGRYATDLFIIPGYHFRAVDALITNFHTPRSSLLVLVSAFAGRERILAAYTEAAAQGYRFFSYGDAMLMV
ncbi:MAG: tRNA preQ1(34) S-adenosylmethionine ribosyltransferase-isomerase QueA [Spirochaetota bacterium]|jgi:S-adenosylmethionine:tRNA ribosyltransferase-isomerase|nr:tRNA preQ1(34) S-adenosylmethionine ribosyltransferase-isomerase QueA [Spirochaetota bacterium]